MRREKGASLRDRIGAAALPLSGLDLLIGGVVLATATGFRFLGERHLRDAAVMGAPDLLVAFEIVLIPLALAAMVLAPHRRARQERFGTRGLLGRKAAAAGAAAALLAALQTAAPPLLPPATPAIAAAGLITADELLRRGFLLNILATALGGGRAAHAAALLLLAGAAAMGHAPGGARASMAAAAGDLVLGTAYLYAGRTLWTPLLARGLAQVTLRVA